MQGQNTRIVNSRFTGGGVPFTHHAYGNSANLYIGYSVIDGAGSAEFLIAQNHSGLTVEYCWLKNAGSDIVGLAGNASGAAILRFNVIENAGMVSGAHGDYTQFIGGPYRVTIAYNTTLQNGGTTQGFMVEPDIGSSSGVILSGDIGHNTFTANGGGLSYFTAVTVPDIVESFIVHDNFFDDSEVYGFAIGGIRGGPGDASSKTTYARNVDMVTGAVVQD